MIDIDQEEKQGKVEKSEEEGTTVATILLIEKNNFLQHSTSKEEFKKDLIVDISCRGDFLKLEKLLFSPTFFCSFFSFEEDLLGKNLARLQQDPSTSLSTNKVEKKEEKSSASATFLARDCIKEVYKTISSSRWNSKSKNLGKNEKDGDSEKRFEKMEIKSCSETITPQVLKLLTNYYEEELLTWFLEELNFWNVDHLNDKLIKRILIFFPLLNNNK